jgi:predicted SnoaL-like aldol condensation-catalyzing enzyme
VAGEILAEDLHPPHLTLISGKRGPALADFFRFEGDKVVEHWGVIQEIPDASANSNGMF